jgi:bacillithiol system protein YtxJ
MRFLDRFFAPAVQSTNMLEIKKTEECHAPFAEQLTVIFKHSRTCGFSRIAYQTVVEFYAARPEVKVYIISVRDSRAAALFVEEYTGVRHESPQVLALRNGSVFAHASHGNITPAFLQKLHKVSS